MARTQVPASTSEVFLGATVGLLDKIWDAQVKLDFRYTRINCLVLGCPMQYLGHAYAIKIIHLCI